MKHTIAFIAFAVLASSFLATSARAGTAVSPAGKGLGIGVELGAPTSINLKLMTAPDAGVVLGLGGGIWYDASISLHADYVVHPLVAQFDNGSFSAFLGGGGWT